MMRVHEISKWHITFMLIDVKLKLPLLMVLSTPYMNLKILSIISFFPFFNTYILSSNLPTLLLKICINVSILSPFDTSGKGSWLTTKSTILMCELVPADSSSLPCHYLVSDFQNFTNCFSMSMLSMLLKLFMFLYDPWN